MMGASNVHGTLYFCPGFMYRGIYSTGISNQNLLGLILILSALQIAQKSASLLVLAMQNRELHKPQAVIGIDKMIKNTFYK